MPDRPLLNLPESTTIVPRQPFGGGPVVMRPSRDRQAERIGPRFARLAAAAATPEAVLALRDDPASIAPERAIVFEVEGSLKDFYTQARDIGLEYLGDFEDDFAPSDDFYIEDKPAQVIGGRIYLAMPDVQALRELLSVWEIYKQNRRMPKGRGEWRELFSRLVDVRPWGPQDRVLPEAVAAWEAELERDPDAPVRLEIELWYHENAERRARAFQGIEALVAEAGGAVLHHVVIPEIHYDAALIDLPAAYVRQVINDPAVSLARADEVMFLRPQSMARFPGRDEVSGGDGTAAPGAAGDGPPVVALLDGLPVQNHARLTDRLLVDDPDGLEATYPVASRAHGTEMASLIVHGDLNLGESPLSRRVYVRPVLQPTQSGERTRADRLLVDVIHQAVRRIKEANGSQPAAAPSVMVINLALGDERRPYARMMSPLGRLLDYLSYRYRVLFLVAAGNVRDRLTLPTFGTLAEFEAATPEQRERAILEALNANKSQRTLLSPAESMNALSIGAAHAGSGAGALPAGRFDPFTDGELPNILSAMGLGFKKIVKPELMFAGGRAPVRIVASGGGGGIAIAPVVAGAHLFGLKAAHPSPTGSTRHEGFTFGTSVATALATRSAHRIHDVLMDAAGGSNHADIDPAFMPLVLKALLVHGAKWGVKGDFLDTLFPPQGTGTHLVRRDDITRLLGYGVPAIDRVLDCAANRATLLGVGTIAADSGQLYRIPLPQSLDAAAEFRALTMTLAWFSPVNPRHQGYRMAALDLSAGSDDKFWIAPTRALGPTDKAVGRGTVFHERRTGEQAAVFLDDGHLLLRLSCRAPAGTLAEPVPYALAISLEVGIGSTIEVYEEIRTQLAQPVPATVNA